MDNPQFTLVHGLVFHDQEKVYFGHAWTEINGFVHDPTFNVTIEKDRYYRLGQIKYTVRYTKERAYYWASETRSYGPWNSRIDAGFHEGNKSLWKKYLIKKRKQLAKQRSRNAKRGDVER